MKRVRSVAVEVAGWILLVLGIAALFLPGPGLLGVFAGLALLSTRYEWAETRVDPVRLRALRGAAQGVATVPRIIGSCLGAVALAACGVLWIVSPAQPDWWNFPEWTWLPGGLWFGVTQILSAVIALALVGYSVRRFYRNPAAVAALSREIKDADHELHDAREDRREHWEERREERRDRRHADEDQRDEA